MMDIESRMRLVARNSEEIITENELRTLLETESKPKAYWGFECSGAMHIGMGLVCGAKINDLIGAGFNFTIFLADWHSWINNKLSGDMENIRTVGEYFKHCFTALGVDSSKVKYVWASDLVNDSTYWEKVIRIAKNASINRVWRTLPIMGREMELKNLETAWVYYPCMQATDIFQLDVDVACAGIDQRKAHMLARDIGEKLGWKKPVCVHTHLLMGLTGLEKKVKTKFDENQRINVQIIAKMSKSIPANCIFIHDSPDDIRKKIQSAFCPPRSVENNPVLDVAKNVVFAWNSELKILRSTAYGGPVEFQSYEAFEKAYAKGDIHPLDLKTSVAEALVNILEPARDYFKQHPETLEKIKNIEVTR